ncbi:hypothetical protein HWV62_26711 [Athelia sp. TMB]|nr:hypothetical protein HWV62_26711 [Athelia sp. TMB]
MAQTAVQRNVIICGQTGAGKSSLVNLIAGKPIAKTSDGLEGCTPGYVRYDVKLKARSGVPALSITLWDTAGFDEGARGTVGNDRAISDLAKLKDLLGNAANLVIYCVPLGVITANVADHYKIIRKTFGDSVLLAIVVTKMENERDADAWWVRNEGQYKKTFLDFNDHACVVATKGNKGVYTKQYNASVLLVHEMLRRFVSNDERKPNGLIPQGTAGAGAGQPSSTKGLPPHQDLKSTPSQRATVSKNAPSNKSSNTATKPKPEKPKKGPSKKPKAGSKIESGSAKNKSMDKSAANVHPPQPSTRQVGQPSNSAIPATLPPPPSGKEKGCCVVQ